MPSPDTAPLLLSDVSVAAYIDVSRSLVWRMVAEGRLPTPIAVPGTTLKRWHREQVDAAIAGWSKPRKSARK